MSDLPDRPTEAEPGPDRPGDPIGPLPTEGIGPLTCTPSLEQLYRYMDGMLDERQRATIKSHLDHCGCCDQLFHFQAGFRFLVGNRCRAELPPDLADRVFRAVVSHADDEDPGRR